MGRRRRVIFTWEERDALYLRGKSETCYIYEGRVKCTIFHQLTTYKQYIIVFKIFEHFHYSRNFIIFISEPTKQLKQLENQKSKITCKMSTMENAFNIRVVEGGDPMKIKCNQYSLWKQTIF